MPTPTTSGKWPDLECASLRRLADEPVAEIVQCGEPISSENRRLLDPAVFRGHTGGLLVKAALDSLIFLDTNPAETCGLYPKLYPPLMFVVGGCGTANSCSVGGSHSSTWLQWRWRRRQDPQEPSKASALNLITTHVFEDGSRRIATLDSPSTTMPSSSSLEGRSTDGADHD